MKIKVKNYENSNFAILFLKGGKIILLIEIQKKEKQVEARKINKAEEIFNLDEVQEIKDAVQEHFIFVGLDRVNNVRNVSILGIGTSSHIEIDVKYIVRTALVTASDRVILVHNHPSNSLKPSSQDKEITNIANQLLKVFNIKLLDHIIVNENSYTSMGALGLINDNYESERTEQVNKLTLIEENIKLKEKIDKLSKKLMEYKNHEKDEEEEFE